MSNLNALLLSKEWALKNLKIQFACFPPLIKSSCQFIRQCARHFSLWCSSLFASLSALDLLLHDMKNNGTFVSHGHNSTENTSSFISWSGVILFISCLILPIWCSAKPKEFRIISESTMITFLGGMQTLDDPPEQSCKNLTRTELSCKSRKIFMVSWKNLARKRLIYLTDISCKKNKQIRSFLRESSKILPFMQFLQECYKFLQE